MNTFLTRVTTHCLGLLIATAPIAFQTAMAAEGAMSSSQSRMAMCSKQNKGKRGDDYQKAQSDCLKGDDTAAATPMTRQQKMTMCSKQNKGKRGADYTTSQSDCLKG